MGVNLLKDISSLINFNIKEIVTIVPDNLESSVEIIKKDSLLKVAHRYLLIFKLMKRG